MYMRRSVFLVIVILALVGPQAWAGEAARQTPADPPEQEAATFNIGVPAGDAYQPLSAVVHTARDQAYVYHADSAERRPVISVVDLSDGEVLRVIRLNAVTAGGLGRLLLAESGQLLLVDAERRELWSVDPEQRILAPLLSDIQDAALSPDGSTLYITGPWGLRAYGLADLMARRAAMWEVAGRFDRLAANAGQIVALSHGDGPQRDLLALDAATGEETARTTLPDYPNTLVAGPDGIWAVTTTGEKPLLYLLDARLEQVRTAAIPYTDGLSYDAPRDRYLLAGFRSTAGGGENVILGLAAHDLAPAGERAWPGLGTPNQFLNWGEDRLLGYTRYGSARLDVLGADLAPTGRIVTGVRAVGMVLDDAAGRLYVADDHDRVHVIGLPDGEAIGVWEGGAPLALDATNKRLYVNLADGVAALSDKGAVVARFPERGYPAPDPRRDLVYIVANGVTMYNRAGKKLGTLASTFPEPGGFVPNIYAQAARVNPVSGYLAVIVNNGVPGSNNGTFLRIYPPKADMPLAPPGVVSFVTDIAFDPSGNFYVTYSPAKNMEAVQRLNRAGREQRRLAGRTGQIALDPAAGGVYLLTEGLVTRIDPQTLTPVEFWQGPDDLSRIVFSARRSAFYVYGSAPAIRAIPLGDLTPVDMAPQPGAPPKDAILESLAVTRDAQGNWLIADYSNGLYRTRDGRRWEKLPVGTIEGWGNVTVADEGVLFWTSQGSSGADGVWRSTDAGNTWQFLGDGLSDLRPSGAVTADGPDRAYIANRTSGLLRWEPVREQWDQMSWQPGTINDVGELKLAPGGQELFHSAWETLRKSTDGGATWEKLEPPARSGTIIGFSGFYTVTETLFGMWGDMSLELMRSTDRGVSWAPLDVGFDLSRDYYTPDIVSAGFDIYLLARPYASDQSVLLRSTDNGDTWEQAPAALAQGLQRIAVAPDGTLWVGGSAGLQALDPAQITWSAVAPSAAALSGTPEPAPTATPAPSSTPTPSNAAACTRTLDAADAATAKAEPRLGCPQAAAQTVGLARQRFERGQMFWREDNATIYVLHADATWQAFADAFREGQAESDPKLTPPAGRLQPVRGFGKVWREQMGAAGASIGWAMEAERGTPGSVQEWDGGLVIRADAATFILLDDGSWRTQ
jgi:photosystem II stability/assembly factor-like uncharacterized protein